MKNETKKRKKLKTSVFFIFIFVILASYTISLFIPLLWGLMNTFKHYIEFAQDPMCFPDLSLFKEFQLYDGTSNSIFSNYEIMFSTMKYDYTIKFFTGVFNERLVSHSIKVEGGSAILTFIWNTALCCIAGTVLPTFMCLMTGYLCAKYKFKFSGFVYALVIFAMSMPKVGNAATSMNLFRKLGIFDNMFGFFILNANFSSMYYLVFYAFFQNLSDSYIEAAEIDGASQFRILTTIIVPLAKGIISATMVVLFVSTWNDYTTALTYLPTHPTLAYGIFYNIEYGNSLANWPPIKLASIFLLAIPTTIVFILFRDKLMGNLSLGGIKE